MQTPFTPRFEFTAASMATFGLALWLLMAAQWKMAVVCLIIVAGDVVSNYVCQFLRWRKLA